MASVESVREIALAMTGVVERTSYGTPAFFVRRTLFARMLEDDDSVVVKIDERDRKRRMAADPIAFFITDHYENYPMMIIRLSAVDDDDLAELLLEAWKHAGG